MPLRWLGWIGAVIALSVAGSSVSGRLGAATATMLALVLTGYVHAILPRAAHARFVDGRLAAARWRYRLLARVALTARGALRARLSVIGCDVATGAYAQALAALDTMPSERFDVDARATWLGNRAYATLRRGGSDAEARTALAWIEEACTLRPDVPALGHTRALALMRIGHTAQAIMLLDALWSADSVAPLLEAERCWDLASAWQASGEVAYADDYRARARAAAAGLAVPPPWLA